MGIRIQRKRTKGWKMPENAIYIGRPTKWGNPYHIEACGTNEKAVEMFEGWLKHKLQREPHFLDDLKGKDLACWCPLTDKNGNLIPCHVDIILKILDEQ